MTSPSLSRGRSLFEEKEQTICNAILRPLFKYLISNHEIDLTDNLHIKCCVISLEHTAEYDCKKNPNLKRPHPDDHLVGSLKEVTE